MKKLLLIIAVICFASVAGKAEQFYSPPAECLMMYLTNDYDHSTNLGNVNPDSIMVDTCAADFDIEKHKTSPIPYPMYAYKGYHTVFETYPFATVLGAGELRKVSEIIFPEVREYFENLGKLLGGDILLKHKYDHLSDSMQKVNSIFQMVLPKHYNLDEIEDYVNIFVKDNKNITSFRHNRILKSFTTVYDDDFPQSRVVNDILYITQENTSEEISILNTLGQRVLTTAFSNEINVAELPQGMYFVIINNKIYKFMKK